MDRPGAPPSHGQVVDYWTGTASASDRALVERFRGNDAVWALFFRTLDGLLRASGGRPRPAGLDAAASIPLRSEMESLFESVCSGSISKTDSDRLTASLLASPVFFERWMNLLSDAEPGRILEPGPEMAPVRMQSDEALLARLKCGPNRRSLLSRRPAPDWIRQAGETVRRAVGSVQALPGRRKWALSFSTVILVLLVTVLGRRLRVSGDADGPFTYDDRVPYGYDMESFRGVPAATGLDPEVDAWISAIKLGVSDYLICDYRAALSDFREAKAGKPALSGKDGAVRGMWERDLFFYEGLSHLALWRTRSKDMDPAQRVIHGEQALRLMADADSVARAYGLKEDGREAYFIGLACSLQDRKEDASRWLGKVKPESAFYEKAVTLSETVGIKPAQSSRRER
jgi:hypothetical protein